MSPQGRGHFKPQGYNLNKKFFLGIPYKSLCKTFDPGAETFLAQGV